MRIGFQADADLNPAIGRGLIRQAPEIDWRPAQRFIRDGTPDPDVLRLAAEDGRVLISRDVATMPSHFATFMATYSSPGVILVPPNTTVGGAIEKLLVVWLTWTASATRRLRRSMHGQHFSTGAKVERKPAETRSPRIWTPQTRTATLRWL